MSADPVRERTVTRRITPPGRKCRVRHREGCRFRSTAALLCTRAAGHGGIGLVAGAAALPGNRSSRDLRRTLARTALGHRAAARVQAPSRRERQRRLDRVDEQDEDDREGPASRRSLRGSRVGGAHASWGWSPVAWRDATDCEQWSTMRQLLRTEPPSRPAFRDGRGPGEDRIGSRSSPSRSIHERYTWPSAPRARFGRALSGPAGEASASSSSLSGVLAEGTGGEAGVAWMEAMAGSSSNMAVTVGSESRERASRGRRPLAEVGPTRHGDEECTPSSGQPAARPIRRVGNARRAALSRSRAATHPSTAERAVHHEARR